MSEVLYISMEKNGGMKKLKISEKDWNEKGSLSGSEKMEKIWEVVKKIGIGDVEEVRKESGEKWVWGSLKKLEEEGRIESKKIGKKMFYRVRKVEVKVSK